MPHDKLHIEYMNGNDVYSTPIEKNRWQRYIGLAGVLGKMANAITNLNSNLDKERRKSNDPILENFQKIQ